MNMVWGPLLRKHGGHLHTPSLHLEQHVYDSMHHQKVYFDSIWEREVAVRREALRAAGMQNSAGSRQIFNGGRSPDHLTR